MEPPTNAEVADVLEQALALMNDSGAHWTQGRYEIRIADGERQYCSVGAVNKASGQQNRYAAYMKFSRIPLRDAALDALAAGLRNSQFASTSWDKITHWNDNERRKWPDIVARFQKTIARLRGEEA